MIRRSDDFKNCGIGDGSTVQVMSRMRGGGKHKDKKSKAEKKQVTGQESVSDKGLAILESEKDKVIQQVEESEEYRNIVACVSEGNDIQVEQKMQCNRTALLELSGLDNGQMDIIECGIRWAVEARRKRKGTEQEQGKKEGFRERAGGDGWICRGENRHRKCRSHPRRK